MGKILKLNQTNTSHKGDKINQTRLESKTQQEEVRQEQGNPQNEVIHKTRASTRAGQIQWTDRGQRELGLDMVTSTRED